VKNKTAVLKAYKLILISASLILLLLLYLNSRAKTNFPVSLDSSFIIIFAVMTLICIPANRLVLKIPNAGELRASEIIYYACFVLFSPLLLALLISVSIMCCYFFKTKKLVKKNILFITANSIMTFIPAVIAYNYINANSNGNPLFFKENFPAFLFAAVICYFLKNTLENLHKIFSRKAPAYYFWNFHSNKTIINLFIIAPLGFFMGAIAKSNISIFLLFMMPLLLIFKTLQDYTALLFEIREALKTISFIIDKKDKSFIFHSYSVANLSKKIAQKLKLSEQHVEKIYHAALIHDLGKIAISDKLLRKETALTREEYEKIKKHPLIGADLIEQLSALQDEALIIKHHHENYDGTGYPEGLDRNKIPLGARILAISEAYSTMICSYPYKKKLSKKDALDEIRMSKGFQFDPKIVETLTSVLKHEN